MNPHQPKDRQPPDSPENFAAKLAVIAGSITTLGDGLATIAAAIALQELENSQVENGPSTKELEKQMKRMQKQLDYLTQRLPRN